MPQPDFVLTYRLVAEDFFAMMKSRWRRRTVSSIGLPVLVILVGLWSAHQYWAEGALLDLLGAMALLSSPITAPMINRWAYRRVFEKQRLGTQDVLLHVSAAGIDCDAANGKSHFPWTAISLVEVTPEHIFLWVNDYLGIIVPKRTFEPPARAEQFVAFTTSQASGPPL